MPKPRVSLRPIFRLLSHPLFMAATRLQSLMFHRSASQGVSDTPCKSLLTPEMSAWRTSGITTWSFTSMSFIWTKSCRRFSGSVSCVDCWYSLS